VSEDLNRIRQEMSDQFKAIRSDIKEISTALVELVRLDGKFNSISELVNRVAIETDDLEKRVRSLENNAGVNNTRIGNSERLVWVLVTATLGLGFAALKAGLI
tara:strand:+ start:18255 stop:18563 length:309 start_codon:yes stop_codon:yes gene_type:complete